MSDSINTSYSSTTTAQQPTFVSPVNHLCCNMCPKSCNVFLYMLSRMLVCTAFLCHSFCHRIRPFAYCFLILFISSCMSPSFKCIISVCVYYTHSPKLAASFNNAAFNNAALDSQYLTLGNWENLVQQIV